MHARVGDCRRLSVLMLSVGSFGSTGGGDDDTNAAMSRLVWGIKNGDIDAVKSMVDSQKINVNESIDGRVPLHYAADYGQKDVLTYLLEEGANPNVVDKHGISVLLAAIWEGHTDCVQILLKYGASKNGLTPDGTSYIDAAEKQEIKELLT